MYSMYTFKGGIYRHDELIEDIEDLGGIIMQKVPMQTEIDIVFALADTDLDHVKNKARALKGEILDIPFGDMEIAIVAPSLSRHHLPHPVCDISEFLRRYGATTNILGLARGYGKTIFQMSDKEKKMIEEHDAAIFSYGIYEECIRIKERETRTTDIPYVICGGPKNIEGIDNYIGNVGRKAKRMKTSEDIATLEQVKRNLLQKVESIREDISKDPPIYPPAYVKRSIEQQLDLKGSLGDNPVVLHLKGMRVKIPYEDNIERVKAVSLGNAKLEDVATLKKSLLNDTILIEMLPSSMVEGE